MNMSDARSILKAGGWIGEFRPVWASEYRTVQKCGHPVYFKTANGAELAAWRALRHAEQKVMRRDGDIAGACDADAAFPTLKPFIKQRGKSRKVEVERKRIEA